MEPITGTNKSILIKDIRHIAEANRFAGNECSWSVFIKEGDNFISVCPWRYVVGWFQMAGQYA